MIAVPLALVAHFGGPALAAASAGAFAGAAAQSITGFGFSLLFAPVLVQLVGAPRAVRIANLLAVGVNLIVLARDRRGVRPTAALWLLLPAAIVTPAAAWVVHRTDPAVLSIVAGTLIIGSALALGTGRRLSNVRGASGMVAAGAVSSAMNTASGVGGPAVAMYALNAEWPLSMTRPTLQLYFLGLNALSFFALGGVSVHARDVGVLFAAVVVGLAAGSALARRLPEPVIGRVVVVMSIVGGTAAVVRGLATV